MMKKFILSIIILFQGHYFLSNAQNQDNYSLIKEQLNPSGKKSITKADKFYSKRENEKKLALQYKGSKKRKALQKEIKASKYFGKANKISYNVFKADLEKFRNTQTDSAKTIRKRLNRAKRLMNEAKDKRNESLKLNVTKNEYSLLKHADELEQKAFTDIFYVYAIYLGHADEKIKVNEQSMQEIAVDNTISEEFTGVKPVKDITSKGVIATGAVAESGTMKNQETKLDNPKSEKPVNASENIDEIEAQTPVYFKIQIAASQTQLSVDHLIKNFKTKEILNVEKEGDWYKYSIRKKFTDYELALNYKNELNIKGAFIIAFKNGRKVSIDEALKKDTIPQNQNIKTEDRIEKPVLNVPEKITYKLQIGFSFNQLGPEEVRQFKSSGQTVTAHNCGTYFIYTVGDFETANAALNFKKLKGLTDANIVKFNNEKLVEE